MDRCVELVNRADRIVVMTGAGVSTAAGIPDFRTPGTGIYSKTGLPVPEDMFNIDFFKNNPKPFCSFVQNIWFDAKPTLAHRFIKMLDERGKLLRLYTQNIDGLDRAAGVSEDKIVEVHGNFESAHCVNCKNEVSIDFVRNEIEHGHVPHCLLCGGPCKPDIVFFGEQVKPILMGDFYCADLLLIMGTSLKVKPFSDLIFYVRGKCPRICFDRVVHEPKTVFVEEFPTFVVKQRYMYDTARDIMIQGDIEEQVGILVKLLGW